MWAGEKTFSTMQHMLKRSAKAWRIDFGGIRLEAATVGCFERETVNSFTRVFYVHFRNFPFWWFIWRRIHGPGLSGDNTSPHPIKTLEQRAK
jgi:hypothetical protein